MKIAIAQVDMRLGDIDAICGRLESQAVIAHEQGARLLCAPAPLLTGTMPGMLMASRGFMHDMLSGLSALSERVALLDIALLVPAVVEYQGTALFETFLLRKGRVVPIRALAALRGERAGEDLWQPPVFAVDGLRCAPVFDFERDIDLVPTGCDVVIYFQAAPFCAARAESAAVASVADGHFRPQVAQRSMWLACVAPVGGFDETAFTGGSFFMDDCGRVIAAAPCFEEALLVQDVQRGITVPCIEDHLLPHFDRSEWLWEALRLWLADAACARGIGGAAVVLAGDLPSSLAAALCVDAFGSRNVVGIVIERARALTPRDEEAERERLDRARAVASGLRIRTVERVEPAFSELLDRDAPPAGVAGRAGAGVPPRAPPMRSSRWCSRTSRSASGRCRCARCARPTTPSRPTPAQRVPSGRSRRSATCTSRRSSSSRAGATARARRCPHRSSRSVRSAPRSRASFHARRFPRASLRSSARVRQSSCGAWARRR